MGQRPEGRFLLYSINTFQKQKKKNAHWHGHRERRYMLTYFKEAATMVDFCIIALLFNKKWRE
jgi:hypothetical protein